MRLRRVTHHDGDNRRLRLAGVKPKPLQLPLEEFRVRPQLLDQLFARLRIEQRKRRLTRRRNRRWMRGRKQEWTPTVIQKLDQVASAGDIPANRTDRLRERTHLHVHAPVHAEVVHRAAPAFAQHAGGVGVVHHHDAAVLVGQVAEGGEVADVAVHRKHAVGYQQLPPGMIRNLFQDFFGVVHVAVAEDLPLCFREPPAVNDAGMVQLVGDDDVLRAQNRLHDSGVGHKARLEHYRRLGEFELRNLLFERQVDVHGSGDGAHRARPHPVRFDGGGRGLLERLVRG